MQLYVRDGDARVCVASLESPRELRTIVPVGARLPLTAGSAGKVLAGTAERWVAERGRARGGRGDGVGTRARPDGRVVAAVSISGPIQRLTRKPGQKYGSAVAAAADRSSEPPAPERSHVADGDGGRVAAGLLGRGLEVARARCR